MPSPFDLLDATSQAACDAAFGEAVRIVPQAKSQYGARSPDPDRPARDVSGIFSLAPGTETPAGQRTGSELNGTTLFVHNSVEVSLTAAVYAGLGYLVRKGDAVLLTERPGEPRYEVVRLAPTGQGDVGLILVTVEGT